MLKDLEKWYQQSGLPMPKGRDSTMVKKVAQQVKTVEFDIGVQAGSGLGLRNFDYGSKYQVKSPVSSTVMNLTK